MNSRTFLYTPEGEEYNGRFGYFHAISTLNSGLLNGQQRSSAKQSTVGVFDPRGSMGTRYRDMIRECPERWRIACHEQFVAKNKATLAASRLPWYVPEWLGGLGLEGVCKPSRTDEQIARLILTMGYEKPTDCSRAIADLRIWKLAESKIKVVCESADKEGVECSAYSEYMNLAVLNLLLDENVSLSTLKAETKELNDLKTVAHNAWLWLPGHYRQLKNESLRKKFPPLPYAEWYKLRTYPALWPGPRAVPPPRPE